jgi:hypothetical protein
MFQTAGVFFTGSESFVWSSTGKYRVQTSHLAGKRSEKKSRVSDIPPSAKRTEPTTTLSLWFKGEVTTEFWSVKIISPFFSL